VQIEINRKAFWMKVGETDENGAFSIGENPIVAQHFFLPQLRAVLSRKIDILSACTSS
jgi:hypothetical protein